MPFTFFRNGAAVASSTGNDDAIFEPDYQDCVLVEGKAYDNRWFYQNGEVHPVPPAPSGMDTFDYATGAWVVSEPKILERRNTLLAESDWTDTASAPARLGQATYDAWQTYRQALRDIPQQPGYPNNVVWPTPPSA